MALNISMDGKAAIVTGASSGIGAGIAEALGEAGARVALVGRNEERLGAVRDRITKANGEAVAIVADLDDEATPEMIVSETLEHFARIDTVVHSAGLFLPAAPDVSLELLDRQWRTNVRAPYALTLAALPELRRRKGSIVFVSSIAGKIAFVNSSAYGATKGAVELLTKTLAIDEAPNGVRVNAIAPGNVETPMNAHLMADPEYLRIMLEATPLGRNGQVGDIAPLAVFLASDASAYTTGESILVDGGWAAR